ncbi:MAG TPA: FAD:protein FMN transferase [Pseudomonadaceae bacterium]|nr:FAD:protein FMN transferase [Pseudomonadaceae bacterium]
MPRAVLKALIIAVVGALLFLALRYCSPAVPLTLHGTTMGTSWNVQVVGAVPSPTLDGLALDIRSLLEHLDKEVFSTWRTDSELNRFNAAAAGQAHALSAHLFVVLAAALRVHEASGGAFDPSVAVLVDLWGFGPAGRRAEPDPVAIDSARARTGMQYLALDVDTRTALKSTDLVLDLSGIAKGYAVDQVAELLGAAGFDNFLVEIGGELRVQGAGPQGKGWTIAIEMPAVGARAAYATINSGGRALAVAGSGDYRNFREVDGQRLSHTIDPLSGRPVAHGLAAVTTIADTAMLADAWATALMVLGPERGRQLADGLQLGAYFIIHENTGFDSFPTASIQPFLGSGDSGRAPL